MSIAHAQTAAEKDAERAANMFQQLRCVVCQNQSIAESEAGVAKDLRQLVREQIADGKTDEQITDFLVARYGEFVLLKPRLNMRTVILWFAPALCILFGLVLMLRMRTSRSMAPKALTEEEERRLAALLDGKK